MIINKVFVLSALYATPGGYHQLFAAASSVSVIEQPRQLFETCTDTPIVLPGRSSTTTIRKVAHDGYSGTCGIDTTNGAIVSTYYPDAGYEGSDSCVFEACDVMDGIMDIEGCREVTFTIIVKDCSSAKDVPDSTKTDIVPIDDHPTRYTNTALARRELSDIDKSTRIKWVLAPHPNVAQVPTPSAEVIIAPTHPSQASVTDFSDYLNEHTGYDPCKDGEQSGATYDEKRSRRGVSLCVLRSLY